MAFVGMGSVAMGTNLLFILCCAVAVYAAINREDIKAGNLPVVFASAD
jgi:hypothetical protein